MREGKRRRFAGYVLVRQLGHGSMGMVYLAEDEANHGQVALKVLSSGIAANGEYTRRFLNEARVATQLDHPAIVSLKDYGRADGHYYLAMEYVDGESCKAAIVKQGRLDWRRAVEVALQVAEGLASAAGQGIIHRDIKPENILIDSAGRVRLTDLGLAKEMDVETPLPSDTSLGTPDYMSPEQVNNSETVDFRSDIYSLGASLFHMVCGKAPYTGRSAYEVMVKHVWAPLPSPMKYAPDLPRPVAQVMRKMMARDPADRYQTYDALIADLKALLAGEQVSASEFDDESLLSLNGTNGRAAAAPPAPRRKLLWVAVASAPILAGVAVLLYLILSS
jgi:serine/threonine-protein kinase